MESDAAGALSILIPRTAVPFAALVAYFFMEALRLARLQRPNSTKKHRRALKMTFHFVLRARLPFSSNSVIIIFLLLRPVASVLPGLQNFVQTCYANAAIQLL